MCKDFIASSVARVSSERGTRNDEIGESVRGGEGIHDRVSLSRSATDRRQLLRREKEGRRRTRIDCPAVGIRSSSESFDGLTHGVGYRPGLRVEASGTGFEIRDGHADLEKDRSHGVRGGPSRRSQELVAD